MSSVRLLLSMIASWGLLTAAAIADDQDQRAFLEVCEKQQREIGKTPYGEYKQLEISSANGETSFFGYVSRWDSERACVYFIPRLGEGGRLKERFLNGDEIFSHEDASLVIITNEYYSARLRPKGAAGASETSGTIDDISELQEGSPSDPGRFPGLVVYGTPEFVSSIVQKSTTKLVRFSQPIEYQGEQCAIAELEFEFPGDKQIRASLKLYCDVEDGMCYRSELELPELDSRVVEDITYYSRIQTGAGRFPQSCVRRISSGDSVTTTECLFLLPVLGRPSSEQFYLKGFGLPEPDTPSKFQNVFSYIMVGVGSLFLVVSVVIRKYLGPRPM